MLRVKRYSLAAATAALLLSSVGNSPSYANYGCVPGLTYGSNATTPQSGCNSLAIGHNSYSGEYSIAIGHFILCFWSGQHGSS